VKSALTPAPSIGSIYFSQAHSLRWLVSGRVGAKLLYREILSYALFFESLIISDSHAVGNWEILEMLPGGRFSAQCPGVERLFRDGIVRIAKRKGASLAEVAQGQIRRKTPVMISGRLRQMDDTFLKSADLLDALSEEHEFTYSTHNLNLAKLLMSEVLDVNSVSEAYGLKSVRLRKEVLRTIDALTKDGPLFASDLFNFRTKTGVLSEKPNISTIQRLATSTHSCNFAVSLGLLPSLSPNSDDHRGATALLERFTPELGPMVSNEEDLSDPTVAPTKILPLKGEQDISRFGIGPILQLRDRNEFRRLQRLRHELFQRFREGSSRTNTTDVQKQVLAARKKFAQALIEFLALIAKTYGLPNTSDAPTSQYLRQCLAESTRKIDALKEFDMGVKYILPAIAAMLASLAPLGLVPHALLFATTGIYAATGTTAMMRLQQLKKERAKIEACSRVLNLAQTHPLD
jgi:hypothetical protein